jgi:hypothetical protein
MMKSTLIIFEFIFFLLVFWSARILESWWFQIASAPLPQVIVVGLVTALVLVILINVFPE